MKVPLCTPCKAPADNAAKRPQMVMEGSVPQSRCKMQGPQPPLPKPRWRCLCPGSGDGTLKCINEAEEQDLFDGTLISMACDSCYVHKTKPVVQWHVYCDCLCPVCYDNGAVSSSETSSERSRTPRPERPRTDPGQADLEPAPAAS